MTGRISLTVFKVERRIDVLLDRHGARSVLAIRQSDSR